MVPRWRLLAIEDCGKLHILADFDCRQTAETVRDLLITRQDFPAVFIDPLPTFPENTAVAEIAIAGEESSLADRQAADPNECHLDEARETSWFST